MPSKRQRMTRLLRPEIPPALVEYLRSATWPARDDSAWVDVYIATGDERQLAATWAAARDDVLGSWIVDRPGTRPWGWWQFDAPRWQRGDLPPRCRDLGDVVLCRLVAPRRRLCGVGTPAYEVLNVAPTFQRGVPTEWVSVFDEVYYNGRARDIHGNRIGTAYSEGRFTGLAPRADDPPVFESEAAYLDRHGLWLPGERARLGPGALAPERVIVAAADEDDGEAA